LGRERKADDREGGARGTLGGMRQCGYEEGRARKAYSHDSHFPRVDGGEEEDPTLEKAAGLDMVLNRRS